jgi:hypothetical protein
LDIKEILAMTFQNEIIDELNFNAIDTFEDIVVSGCVINAVEISGGVCKGVVKISNSIINNLTAIGRRFEFGLEISNCVFNESVSFEAGGHNERDKTMLFEGNVFRCFVDFYDAQYHGPFVVKNNIFLEGTSLLGNKGTVVETLFESGVVCENNLGKMDID